MEQKPAQYHVVYGDAANMEIIRSGEVDLILTGPPYFSRNTESLLKNPVGQQDRLEQVRKEITSFALTLRPIYAEIGRVLKPDGFLAIQIKDIRYRNVLIDLSSLHRQMIEALGFVLITRIYWHKRHRWSWASRFRKNPFVGSFRADDVEDVLIFCREPVVRRKIEKVDLTQEEIDKSCRSPLWDMAPAGRKRKHPHQSPQTLVRRVIAFYSQTGDLVVDPFAGSGTVLRVAVKMNRRAIGYEIDRNYARIADEVAESALKPKTKRGRK